jgi:hypothetical protein
MNEVDNKCDTSYPYIGIFKDSMIVYFTAPSTGFVVYDKAKSIEGLYIEGVFQEEVFKPLQDND